MVTIDGYLANCEELRTTLLSRGAVLRNNSDAELTLRAFETWGADFAIHLEGEFALLIWDEQHQQAICARDHHGLRPLHYYRNGGLVLVASDVSAIIAALQKHPSINRGKVAEYAADEFFAPEETIWQGIFSLVPAHTLQIAAQGQRLARYWSLPTTVRRPFKRFEEYSEEYAHVLKESVRRSSRSHRPVACDVSGGLDSSAIFAIAHDMMKAGEFTAPRLTAHTFATEPGSPADEADFVKAMADFTGQDITSVPLFLPEFDWFVSTALRQREMLPWPNTAMMVGIQHEAARSGCRAILNGVGGDQWLDGTRYYYRELALACAWSIFQLQFREDREAFGLREALHHVRVGGLMASLPIGLRDVMKRIFMLKAGQNKMPEWLSGQAAELLLEKRRQFESRFPKNYAASYKLRKLENPKLQIALGQLARQAAAAGIETRSPMLSRSFIEFSATTPEHTRLSGAEGKKIHRAAMKDLLPAEILDRFSKADFSTVFTRHFGTVLNDLPAADGANGLLGPQAADLIGPMLRCKKEIDSINPWSIWGLANLNLAIREYGVHA